MASSWDGCEYWLERIIFFICWINVKHMLFEYYFRMHVTHLYKKDAISTCCHDKITKRIQGVVGSSRSFILKTETCYNILQRAEGSMVTSSLVLNSVKQVLFALVLISPILPFWHWVNSKQERIKNVKLPCLMLDPLPEYCDQAKYQIGVLVV